MHGHLDDLHDHESEGDEQVAAQRDETHFALAAQEEVGSKVARRLPGCGTATVELPVIEPG